VPFDQKPFDLIVRPHASRIYWPNPRLIRWMKWANSPLAI